MIEKQKIFDYINDYINDCKAIGDYENTCCITAMKKAAEKILKQRINKQI